MKNTSLALYSTILVCALLGLSACQSTGADGADQNDGLMLQIKNSTSADTTEINVIYGDIAVKLIPEVDNINFTGSDEVVDFGTLAVGETSDLKAAPSSFRLEINGKLFEELFGIDDQPTSNWVIEVQVSYDNKSLGYSQQALF